VIFAPGSHDPESDFVILAGPTQQVSAKRIPKLLGRSPTQVAIGPHCL